MTLELVSSFTVTRPQYKPGTKNPYELIGTIITIICAMKKYYQNTNVPNWVPANWKHMRWNQLQKCLRNLIFFQSSYRTRPYPGKHKWLNTTPERHKATGYFSNMWIDTKTMVQRIKHNNECRHTHATVWAVVFKVHHLARNSSICKPRETSLQQLFSTNTK